VGPVPVREGEAVRETSTRAGGVTTSVHAAEVEVSDMWERLEYRMRLSSWSLGRRVGRLENRGMPDGLGAKLVVAAEGTAAVGAGADAGVGCARFRRVTDLTCSFQSSSSDSDPLQPRLPARASRGVATKVGVCSGKLGASGTVLWLRRRELGERILDLTAASTRGMLTSVSISGAQGRLTDKTHQDHCRNRSHPRDRSGSTWTGILARAGYDSPPRMAPEPVLVAQ
jgi:hypothetical protein